MKAAALFAGPLLLASVLAAVPAAAAPADVAPGAPGALSHFDLARKDCVGTAANRSAKVWFTVAGGVLSDVYSPTIDNTNVETMQFVVTDGRTFTHLQTRDTTYTTRALDASGMSCRVTSTPRAGGYRIVADFLTDPRRDSVVVRVRLVGPAGLALYVRLDPTVNGNGGGGTDNGGADDATVDPATTALVSTDTNTATNATNRTYAVPTSMALRADRPFVTASSGYAGTASDGLTQLDATHSLATTYRDALHGNVVQTARVDLRDGAATLALGFGRDPASAIGVAGASANTPFGQTRERFADGWRDYDRGLRQPPGWLSPKLAAAYRLSANVVKASEDKTFPGAIVASVASPWGQAVSAGATPNGRPVYFGSYREVFARDLYEAYTALLVDGDLATARDTVRFLFERQQLADGRLPRNSLLNGQTAPDTGGDQLDESSYPILMAWQAGLGGDAGLWPRIRRAADFVVSHGPTFGSERWEEQSGYSPSTIAAEIAGLVAAGAIADIHGDHASAIVYRATADEFQRSIKGWTVTTSGPYAPRYFIRLSKTGDPNAAVSYNLGNGSVTADQRSIVDGGFLELTRLGILPAGDSDIRASLPVVDRVIGRQTQSGQGFYRYGTDLPGSEDGYGDCYEPDPTTCPLTGQPWPTANSGSGHLWPVLSGERAEQQLQTGDRAGAARLLRAMNAYASDIGLVPEQDWENPDFAASPYGTPPETASIGYVNGEGAGSASPLTWAQAQQVRLTLSLGAGKPVEQPEIVRDRYVEDGPPGALALTVDSPADGTVTPGSTAHLTGATAPGARVAVSTSPTDVGAPTTTVAATADGTGHFAVDVALGFGTNVVTIGAERGKATGYRRLVVVSTALPGNAVLDVADPAGDDHGPGTYAYPTSDNFHDGAFDIERFQVIDAGDRVFLRTQLRDLTPTFGSPLGAQLLDIYIRDPHASAFSTAAPFLSRNYAIAADSAWSSRIEAQGFADGVFVDAANRPLGTVAVTANQATRSILVSVPKAALGQPGTGWVFTVALHGQDGFSGDRARGFDHTPQPFLFGVCAPGGTSPICAIDPGTAPKVVDTVPPSGIDQATELDPTRGPVTLHGVPVP
ncbi:MAG: glucan 1,4-alpha-glucosidase [Actinobacteria bacterium 13_2_20CM_2_71_6]|nr:MAG: glucan 1,4-alpha-glucosidase [Actinobacteria bacterium 13_2_20CM_2_71_6]